VPPPKDKPSSAHQSALDELSRQSSTTVPSSKQLRSLSRSSEHDVSGFGGSTAATSLGEENRRLRVRVSELETAVESCLDLVSGLRR
jgi:hypothetical protein